MGKTLKDFSPISIEERQISRPVSHEPSDIYRGQIDNGLSQVRGTRNSMGPSGASTRSRRPLDASYDANSAELSIVGLKWRDGATGAWNVIPWQTLPAGPNAYLYLNIEQAGAELTSGPVALEVKINEMYPDVLELSEVAPYPVTVAHVLVASVVGGVVQQHMNGNFTLYLEQTEGSVTRWPTTVGGSPPPPPAP